MVQDVLNNFTRIKSFEKDIINLEGSHKSEILLTKFRDSYADLLLNFNEEYHIHRGNMREIISSISSVERIVHYLIFATISVGILISYLLFKDASVHRRLAMYDSLTGLNNRLWLNRRLARLAEKQVVFNFYLIDLDGFKNINDTYGHHVGDEFLRCVSSLLKQLITKRCFVARMGGDEFALVEVVTANGKGEQPSLLVERLMSRLQSTLVIAGIEHQISASIGMSQYPTYAQNVSQLLKQADTAMYDAKSKGKDQLSYFSKRHMMNET